MPKLVVTAVPLRRVRQQFHAQVSRNPKERNTRTGFLERDQVNSICVALEGTEMADDGRKKAGELGTSCGSRSPPRQETGLDDSSRPATRVTTSSLNYIEKQSGRPLLRRIALMAVIVFS